MRKLSIFLLLLELSLLSYSAQAEPFIPSTERIRSIIQELETISQERENYLTELENTNNERKLELKERLSELKQREKELKELKLQLEVFGSLIDDQAIYLKNLNRKLTFWKITSGVLLTGLTRTLIFCTAQK